MFAIVITALIALLVSSLFGYVVHRALHQSWTGSLHQKHMKHHLDLYPPTDYQSVEYRSAGNDNTFKTFAIASVPLVATPIVLGIMGILPLSLTITVLVVMGIMGFLHDYLHDAFHIKNHFLTRIPVLKKIFSYWNHLHFRHHQNMNKNFGILFFAWDRLFDTFG